ncbi:type II toxin-antitoxin system YoeB family toxin [Streptomyces sp. P01-B04]|nr:type II toxin-antitoxin system YoeB family toxin [Streptomyces poriferorum]MBW5258832.1 type II toxin-antitoxin system YoeB family toxin [Streptomyces poriferorum]
MLYAHSPVRFRGYWSRRIGDEHRPAYRVAADEVRIASCRYHYGR